VLQCDIRAFNRCPYNKTCVSVDQATFTEGSDCDLFNQKVLQTPITNGDRVRTMSDKKLKAWYCKGRDCGGCRFASSAGCSFLKWIKEEVKNEPD
jgi:hypothetical protein